MYTHTHRTRNGQEHDSSANEERTAIIAETIAALQAPRHTAPFDRPRLVSDAHDGVILLPPLQ